MGKWEIVKLGEVATLLNGRAYKQDELLESGKTPILRVGNFFSNRGWYYSDLELDENKYCEKGDLLYAWSASFGPKIWDGPKAIFHYHIWRLILTKVINKEYLFYLLQKSTGEIKRQGHGIAMLHVTKGGMEQMKIPLPPLDVQKKIAKTLDTASELIALRKKQLAELDNLIKSTFYDMFGDPVTNEKGWGIKKIGELIIDVKNGITRRGIEDSAGRIVLKLKDIKENYIDFGKCNRFILEEKEEKLFRVSKNQMLFVRVNGNPNYVGRCAVFGEYHEYVYYNDHIMRVSLNNEIIDTCYLSRLLNFPYGKKEIKNHIKTSAGQFTINQQGLSSITVAVPPVSLQNQFAEIVTKIEEQKSLVQKALDQSQYLFDSLMSEYFE